MTTAQTDPPAKAAPHIHFAIRAIMEKVVGVAKAGEFKASTAANAPTRYRFQKYDDMAAALGVAFREQGVMIQASIIKLTMTEWDKTKDGGLQRNARAVIEKRFKFTSLVDGSILETEAAGEGFDNSDKAVNKAETGAIKNALKQAFLLSTGEDDPDATRPDDTGRPVETVLNDPWRAAENAVAQAAQTKREYPPKALELASKAVAAINQCQTTGDLDKLLNWATGHVILTVPVDGGVPLGSRLIAAKATLPVGPPSSGIGSADDR